MMSELMLQGSVTELEVMLIVDTLGDLYPSIGHAPWDGLHLADLVMPYFLLISGNMESKKFFCIGLCRLPGRTP